MGINNKYPKNEVSIGAEIENLALSALLNILVLDRRLEKEEKEIFYRNCFYKSSILYVVLYCIVFIVCYLYCMFVS